ncbi:MAG TPA: DUF3747 domain-containing protein [Xenococcaceae cyanobacterium]
MKLNKTLPALALGASVLTSSLAITAPSAVAFEAQPVNQGQFMLVAVPFGYKEYRLEIIEQLPGGQPCWQEIGVSPVAVNLLLNDFDYSNSCRRITNTNGYTLRVDGQDDRVGYINKIVYRNGELQLVAFHKDPTQPDFVIAHTGGFTEGSTLKLFFSPGWNLTKRVHQGQVVNHVYLSGNSALAQRTNPKITVSNNNSPVLNNGITGAIPSSNLNSPATLNSQTLVAGVSQVYDSFVNPLLNNFVAGIDHSCQGTGVALWSEPSLSPQRTSVYADGTLVFNNQMQFNIQPALAQNGINPQQFLAARNSVQLDFDNDGVRETLTIEQPVTPCYR